MNVTLVVPSQLRELVEGRSTLAIGGSVRTVGDALRTLTAAHTGFYDRLMTEQGELRPHVNVFVGRENIRHTGGLDTPVEDGAELFVLPSVSGG